MNNFLYGGITSGTIRAVKFYSASVTLTVLMSLCSACAQNTGDPIQPSNRSLSDPPNVPSVQAGNDKSIENIRKAVAESNYRELAELLKSKPNLDIRNEDDNSLLIEAMRTDIRSFEMLLEAGADPNFTSDVAGCAASERCLKSPSYIAFESGNLPALKLLLQYRADPNKESILAWAVSRSNREAVDLMLAYKADVNFNEAVGVKGQTPIFFAVEPEIAEQLVKSNADINQTDENGETPLMAAIEEENLEMVRFFVKNGANINAKNKKGETLL